MPKLFCCNDTWQDLDAIAANRASSAAAAANDSDDFEMLLLALLGFAVTALFIVSLLLLGLLLKMVEASQS